MDKTTSRPRPAIDGLYLPDPDVGHMVNEDETGTPYEVALCGVRPSVSGWKRARQDVEPCRSCLRVWDLVVAGFADRTAN